MAVAVAGAALVCAAAVPAVATWSGTGHSTAGFGQAAALNNAGSQHGPTASASQYGSAFTPKSDHASILPLKDQPANHGSGRHRSGQPSAAQHSAAQPSAAQHSAAQHGATQPSVTTVYRNPMRGISGLIPERIDQGVDFGGTGSIYAIGSAVITQACGDCYGWPGGGWITYRLTDGPAAGLMVFVAEDVRPTVSVGQAVTSATPIATMFAGGDGIETGWAMASTATAESQLPEAGGISGGGPFPTQVGTNFDELLQALGVPAGNNRYSTAYGLLPTAYSADWATALRTSHNG